VSHPLTPLSPTGRRLAGTIVPSGFRRQLIPFPVLRRSEPKLLWRRLLANLVIAVSCPREEITPVKIAFFIVLAFAVVTALSILGFRLVAKAFNATHGMWP
jgi:hypothetical protein